MTTYTINYTETEEIAMQYTTSSINEWIQNAAHHRASVAIDDIVQTVVRKCLETNTQIPSSKELMVDLAFTSGWLNQPEVITPII